MLGNSASTSFPLTGPGGGPGDMGSFHPYKPKEAPTKKKLTCTTFHKFDAIFLSLVKAHKH